MNITDIINFTQTENEKIDNIKNCTSLFNTASDYIGKIINKEDVYENISIFFDRENKKRFYYIEGNSQAEETKLKLLNKIKKVNILFIDGDHNYDSVIKDFEMYSDLVS